MTQEFPNIWYATPEKLASFSKWVVFSDRGRLENSSNGLNFVGAKSRLPLSRIRAVSLVRQQIPWLTYAVSNMVLVAYLVLFDSEAFGERPELIAIVLIAVNVCGLMVGYGTRWVRVEYERQGPQGSVAYFADGSGLGWTGIFGGTKRLYQSLVTELEKKPAPQASS